jgi:uncharacterized membrane protein
MNMKHRPGIVMRQLHAHKRLVMSIILGVMSACVIPHAILHKTITRVLVGWNVSTWLYLILVGIMMLRSTPDCMRSRARTQDEGKRVLLIQVIITSVASLVAITAELVLVKDMTGYARATHIALVAFTIAASWAFTHLMFALHYAHDFYATSKDTHRGGLEFPETENPDYADFLYFAGVIGTSGQTADVSFTSQRMRRIGLIHCVLAFFFNTTVLALTINIAASLL